jgi:hypothetical protein
MRWLTLLLTVPPAPIRHRVGVWRKLRRMGAVPLKGSGWLLPETPETTELFQWLAQEIQSVRGQAMLLRVDGIEPIGEDQVAALFHQARADDYQALMRGCRDLLAQIDRQRTARGSSESLKAKLEALKRELDRIQAIAHLQSPLGAKARGLWESVAARVRALDARPPARSRRPSARPPAGSTWVTRPRPHIDRIASAWLIKRFIDPDATFLFAEPRAFPPDAIPFDAPGVELGHDGDDCTFETLLKRSGLRDRRLTRIAEIVHEADLRDGKFPRDEARGIDLAIKGLLAASADDAQVLAHGFAIFEGLYAGASRKE